MLSRSLGVRWEKLASYLLIDSDTINFWKNKYKDRNTWRVQVFDLLEASQSGLWFIAGHDPEIIGSISAFLETIQDVIELDVLFTHLEKIDVHLSVCARKLQTVGLNPELTFLSQNLYSFRFRSYMFFQWLKKPDRKHKWGHVIPNTILLPHQQSIYDWALHNPEIIVVLWFDSINLTKKEINEYYGFEKNLSKKVMNVIILDIRKIAWCPVRLNYYQNNRVVRTLSPLEVLEENSFNSLGDKLDFLKIRLLYEGGCAIRSCLINSKKRQDLISMLPTQGLFLDLDYIPQHIDISTLHTKPICLDDTLRTVSGYTLENNGVVTFGGHFINSLIAVNNNHIDILGECLRVDMDGKTRLPYYWGLLETLAIFRDCLAGTRDFRMRGYLGKYKGDFLPVFHGCKNPGTWRDGDQNEIDQQRNQPLNHRSFSDTSDSDVR